MILQKYQDDTYFILNNALLLIYLQFEPCLDLKTFRINNKNSNINKISTERQINIYFLIRYLLRVQTIKLGFYYK